MRGLGRERQCGTTASPCIRSGARPGTLIFHARVKARPSTDGTPLWERDVYAPGSARSRVGPGSRRLSWALRQADIGVRIVDPKRVRNFALSAGRLAKNDPIDAEMIAWFAETFSEGPTQVYDAA